MKRLAVLFLLFDVPLHGAVPNVASANSIRVRAGVYRVTGVATIETIAGLRDGDTLTLLPAGAFSLANTGNISPVTTTATPGRPLHFVVANGVVYETGPSVSSAPVAATTNQAGIVELATDGENAANVVVQGNDGRLSNTRVPTAHAASHSSGGTDAITHNNLAGLTTGDPHTQYQQESEKGQANGYASLGATTLVPTAQLGTGTANNTVFLRGDQTWAAAGAGGGAPTGATYVTLSTDATLTAERTLAGEASVVSVTDGGAGAAVTVGIAANGITAAKLFQIAGSSVVGRFDSTAGNAQQISAGAANQTLRSTSTGLSFTAIPSCSNATTSKLLYDTTANTFSCGTDQTGGGTSPTVLILGSDVSTAANTTPVDLTGMTFTATAGKTYFVEIAAAVQAPAATTGHGFGVNCANAPVLVAISGAHQLANTGTTTRWSSIANNAIVGITSGVPSAATNVPSVGEGIIQAHAASTGSCQFIFRSETTAVTTAKAGTVIRVTQLN